MISSYNVHPYLVNKLHNIKILIVLGIRLPNEFNVLNSDFILLPIITLSGIILQYLFS